MSSLVPNDLFDVMFTIFFVRSPVHVHRTCRPYRLTRILPVPLAAPEVMNSSDLAADLILVMILCRHAASVDIECALRRGVATRAVGALRAVLSCLRSSSSRLRIDYYIVAFWKALA